MNFDWLLPLKLTEFRPLRGESQSKSFARISPVVSGKKRRGEPVAGDAYILELSAGSKKNGASCTASCGCYQWVQHVRMT